MSEYFKSKPIDTAAIGKRITAVNEISDYNMPDTVQFLLEDGSSVCVLASEWISDTIYVPDSNPLVADADLFGDERRCFHCNYTWSEPAFTQCPNCKRLLVDTSGVSRIKVRTHHSIATTTIPPILIDGRPVDRASLVVEGVDAGDVPDFSDAYFSDGCFADGDPLTVKQLDTLSDQERGLLNELAFRRLTGS